MNNIIAIIIIIIIIGIFLISTESFNGEPCDVKPMPNISYYRPNLVNENSFQYLQGVDVPYPISKPFILVGYHYTQWAPACELMRPVWDRVKENIMSHFDNVKFIENDEGLNVTPGISTYPNIRKYVTGRAYIYTGPIEYDTLRSWILDPVHQNLIYGFR